MEIPSLHTHELRSEAKKLRVGQKILLTGTIYTARDAAHKRMFQMLDQGETLPIPLKDAIIYYAGPTGTKEGYAIGSCGPTTSGRMDIFSPRLLDMGLCAMIGKGERHQSVVDAIVRNEALYLCAVGGAGALASKCITSCEVVAFEDLGCESIKKLTIDSFPLIVANDTLGADIFKMGREKYMF